MADLNFPQQVEVTNMRLSLDSGILAVELSDRQLRQLADYIAIAIKEHKYE